MVFLGSPADKGGIQPGDFITHIDGREVRTVNQVTMTVGDIKPGDRASFTVIRDKAAQNISVRIEVRTEEVTSDNKNLWPGAYVIPLTDAARNSLELDKNARGLLVAQVIADSPASIVGLRQGDRILKVNGEAVQDLSAFYRVLREKAKTELWFEIARGDATLESLRFKR
jgi:S1-C subfamily serine protease